MKQAFDNALSALSENEFAVWPLEEQRAAMLLKDPYGASIIHAAAHARLLRNIPSHFLTWAAVTQKDKQKATPLHKAAANGCLSQLPRSCLTQKGMLLKDTYGKTPMHFAAFWGYLAQVPSELLTAANLLTPDHIGETPLHYCAHNNDFDHVCRGARVTQAFLTPTLEGETPLHCYLKQGHDITKLAKIANRETFRELLKWILLPDNGNLLPLKVLEKCRRLHQKKENMKASLAILAGNHRSL